jgi:hypothetical protein
MWQRSHETTKNSNGCLPRSIVVPGTVVRVPDIYCNFTCGFAAFFTYTYVRVRSEWEKTPLSSPPCMWRHTKCTYIIWFGASQSSKLTLFQWNFGFDTGILGLTRTVPVHVDIILYTTCTVFSFFLCSSM